jgi:hypothetical protein
VATRLNDLAGLYEDQGRYAEAEPLYLRALVILLAKLGADHPNTQTVQQNFRLFLQAVVQAQRLDELSDDPMTQGVVQQLRKGSGE